MNDSVDLTGLDYDFLRYIGVNPSDQRQHQSFYLSFFKGSQSVADIGCGDGDFVELLREQGIDAFGVDSDPLLIQQLRQRQVPFVEADVVAYLKSAAPDSLAGIYSAHLVEHLPYQAVYEVIHYAYRALKPGGRIVLTTPNVRALISHLEMYWLHFGHVAFYHPQLLCFFLQRAGFKHETWGEHPPHSRPLLGDLQQPAAGIAWEAEPSPAVLGRWPRFVRSKLAHLLGLDDIVRQANLQLGQTQTSLNTLIERLDRPFECYVTAIKE